MSRYKFPPNFVHMGQAKCASCRNIEKNPKTRTAFCRLHGVTFPLYESADHYLCDDHEPVIGKYLYKPDLLFKLNAPRFIEPEDQQQKLPDNVKESELEPT